MSERDPAPDPSTSKPEPDPPGALSRGRAVSLALAAALLWLVAADESWAVYLLMLAPFVDVWPARDPAERRARLVGDLVKLVIGAGAAIALHVSFMQMLGGYVRPREVVFNAWVLTGALFALEYLDRGLRRAFGRWPKSATARLARLLVIIGVALPGAGAMFQVVRSKIGYELPADALAMKPEAFVAESADGVRIRGLFFDRDSDVTLVVAHGLGAHAENFLDYLTVQLGRQPVNGLIFDFRGHGFSDGHTSTFGVREADDLRAALGWLRAEHPQRARAVILYGFSMGSAAAVKVAAHDADDYAIQGLIIDSGFARLTDVASALGSRLPPGLGDAVVGAAVPMACVLAGADLFGVAPAEDLDRIEWPVLILHGSDDSFIPVEQGAQLMKHRSAAGHTIARGDHTNLPSADPGYYGTVGRYIELILNDRRPRDADGEAPSVDGPSIGPPPAP